MCDLNVYFTLSYSLFRLLITRALSAGRNTTLDPAVTTSKYGTYLFTQG